MEIKSIWKSINRNRTHLFWILPIGLVLYFHINNFLKYSPWWGYDGPYHLQYIFDLSTNWRLPVFDELTYNGYADNPPFYYAVGALILKLTKSLKTIQFLSLATIFIEIYLLFKTVSLVSKNKILNLVLILFFSLLPLTLANGYMVFNYSLANLLFILILYLWLNAVSKNQPINYRFIVLVSVISGIGLLTSLTALAAIAITLTAILIFSPKPKKLRFFWLYIVLTVAIISPYVAYKQKTYNCLFCAPHRAKAQARPNQIYPPSFYYKFSLKVFRAPYAHNLKLENSLWAQLYTTFYGDYFNYLVEPTLEGKPPQNTIQAGSHFISRQKIANLIKLNYIGIPISVFFLYAIWRGFRDFSEYISSQKQKYMLGFFMFASSVLIFLQFFVYIHIYPEYINIHAGYLYPAVFMLLTTLACYLPKNKTVSSAAILLFLIYSATAYQTFLMK